MQKSAPVTPEQTHLAPIVHEVERYIRRRRISASAFGMTAMGDPNFVRQLRQGRDPSSRIVERVRSYMNGED